MQPQYFVLFYFIARMFESMKIYEYLLYGKMKYRKYKCIRSFEWLPAYRFTYHGNAGWQAIEVGNIFVRLRLKSHYLQLSQQRPPSLLFLIIDERCHPDFCLLQNISSCCEVFELSYRRIHHWDRKLWPNQYNRHCTYLPQQSLWSNVRNSRWDG